MRWPIYLLLASLFLLIPSPARAWGPAAHLEFGLEVLRDLALLAPAVAALLRRFPVDFLYGNIAADITVGKSLSPYKLHCHNWQVGMSVLDMAESDSTRAFAWGYLSHLAADVVAHNYFVPYKVVEHYRRRRAAHVYWEMRFDTWMSAESWEMARSLSGMSFKKHDRHLRAILTGPLFSFRVNKQIFNSIVLFSQILRWKRTVDAYAKSTKMRLPREEVEEMRRLSVERVRGLLVYGNKAACMQADPTGHRNLLIARDIRKRLRRLYLEGNLDDPEAIGNRFRPLFRHAIDAKLELPSMQELIDHPETGTMLLGRKKSYRKPGSRSARKQKHARVVWKAKRRSGARKKIMARVKSRVLHEVKRLRRPSRPR